MAEPHSSEPPPLPPPVPATPEVPLILSEETATSAPPPPPAPLLWRTLAYLLDWLIALLATLVLLQWLIPSHHAEGLAELKTWFAEVWNSYQHLIAHPASGITEFRANVQAFLEKAANPPKSVEELSIFVATVQTTLFWSYFCVVEFFTGGASLGKKVFNLRVASSVDMGPPGFFDTFVRSGWKSIFFCSSNPVLLLIGAIDAHVPLFNDRRRSWHDMLSRTEVIDARFDPWTLPVEEQDDDNTAF